MGILDCWVLENLWLIAEDEDSDMTNLVWVQIVSRLQCILLPLFSRNHQDEDQRDNIIEVRDLFAISKTCPLVNTVHQHQKRGNNDFVSLQILYWSACKTFGID